MRVERIWALRNVCLYWDEDRNLDGVGITLLDGVRECARAGSCNASIGDTGGKTGRQGV